MHTSREKDDVSLLRLTTYSSRITDALVAADGHLNLSKATGDMDAYIKLTDEVFQRILWSDDSSESMKKVCSVSHLTIHSEMICFLGSYRLVKSCNDCKEGICTSVLWISPVMNGRGCRCVHRSAFHSNHDL